jgi:isoleucyl-tRNA synthetase
VVVKKYNLEEKYVPILKDELNIKDVKFEEGQELEVVLDTNITEDLKQEGNYREFVRAIQDIRKKNNLNPSDLITLVIKTTEEGQGLIERFKEGLQKLVSAKNIEYKENDGEEIKIDQLTFIVKVVK